MNNLMTKSFLSYVDLKKEVMKDLEAEEDIEAAGAELEAALRTSADKNLYRFFEEAGEVKEDMAGIRTLLNHLQKANEEGKSLHKAEALRSLRSRINSDIVEILKIARRIRDRLEEMDRANAANRRLSGYREGTPIDRTRTSVTNGLRKKLKGLMLDFQALRQRIMGEYKEAVERRYFTITGEVPDEDVIDRIIAEDRDVLKKAIAEQGRGKVMETVEEIQGRYDAAKEIERSLLELHQVFLDMAVLVEAQGDSVDDIENHVSSAAHYVNRGTKELKTAKEYQRSNRKWLCVGIIIFLLLILVVVIPIATSLKKT